MRRVPVAEVESVKHAVTVWESGVEMEARDFDH